MTEIRSIHGIKDGNLSRPEVANFNTPFLPYLSMTKGEMRLALLQQQAVILSKAYPELPEFKKAAALIDNALNAGVSRGVSISGVLDNSYLQQVAGEIRRATRMQQPAAKIGFLGRSNIAKGIHIGIIPVEERMLTCIKAAKGNPAKMFACQKAFAIEKILNDGIIKAGHHLVYKNLKSSDGLPSDVATKRLFQQSGVEGLAIAGNIDRGLMYEWVELAILKNNAIGGVGAIGSRETSFILGGRPGINEPVSVTVLAIATLISAALGGAAALLKQLRSEKAYAMAEAKGFGTLSVSANQDDWLSGGSSNNLPLLAAAGAAAYILLND